MRRAACLILAVFLVFSGYAGAMAQESFHLAGYDGESIGRDWETNLFFKRLGEKFDMGFTFTSFSSLDAWSAEKARYLQGADLPDVLFKAELKSHEINALYDAGLIIDLAPYIESHMPNLASLLNSNPAWREAITLKSGAIAALPSIVQPPTNNHIWINTAWLEALNLQMPTDIASFENVLRAFLSRDPNRNGKQDEIPLTFLGVWDLKFLAHAFGLIANDYNVFADEDGKVRHLANEPAFREFVEWAYELYQQGLIDRDGFTTSDSLRRVTDDNATMTYGMLFSSTPLNLLPKANAGDYQILMPLTYEGKQVYRELTGEVFRGALAVSAVCENPGKLLTAIDYLYGSQGAMLAQAGLEGVEYAYDDTGRWMWLTSDQTDLNEMIRTAAIADGGTLPYYLSAEIMLSFNDEISRMQVEQMMAFSEYTSLPIPFVMIEDNAQARLDSLQYKLGAVFEKHVGRFVLGQVEINDDTWRAFVEELNDNGLAQLIDIWQSALDASTV